MEKQERFETLQNGKKYTLIVSYIKGYGKGSSYSVLVWNSFVYLGDCPVTKDFCHLTSDGLSHLILLEETFLSEEYFSLDVIGLKSINPKKKR